MLKNHSNIGTNEILSSSGIIAKAVAGGGMLFIGLCLFILNVVLPESWLVSKHYIISTSSIVLLFAGLSLIIWSIVSLRILKTQILEKKTLQIASRHKGVLTAAQLAIDAKINVSNADQLLRKLQMKGVAEIDANEKGAVCFKFYDLMT